MHFIWRKSNILLECRFADKTKKNNNLLTSVDRKYLSSARTHFAVHTTASQDILLCREAAERRIPNKEIGLGPIDAQLYDSI